MSVEPTPNGLTAEESRLKRLEKQQSRYRHRFGTFVPSEHNPLLDALLARGPNGESPSPQKRTSPRKPARRKSRIEEPAVKRPKAKATRKISGADQAAKPRKSTTKKAPRASTSKLQEDDRAVELEAEPKAPPVKLVKKPKTAKSEITEAKSKRPAPEDTTEHIPPLPPKKSKPTATSKRKQAPEESDIENIPKTSTSKPSAKEPKTEDEHPVAKASKKPKAPKTKPKPPPAESDPAPPKKTRAKRKVPEPEDEPDNKPTKKPKRAPQPVDEPVASTSHVVEEPVAKKATKKQSRAVNREPEVHEDEPVVEVKPKRVTKSKKIAPAIEETDVEDQPIIESPPKKKGKKPPTTKPRKRARAIEDTDVEEEEVPLPKAQVDNTEEVQDVQPKKLAGKAKKQPKRQKVVDEEEVDNSKSLDTSKLRKETATKRATTNPFPKARPTGKSAFKVPRFTRFSSPLRMVSDDDDDPLDCFA